MASGVVADFARMPTQRKVLVFVVIGGLLGVAYWKLAYKSLDEDVDAAQASHDSNVATSRRLANDIPQYEALRTNMTRLRELIEKNQTALPTGPELPAFFETLQHKVAESGVEIRRWTNKPEEPVETFIKVPVDIEIAGTFLQIKRFFASLVQRDIRPAQADDRASAEPERIVSIENVALASPTVRNREIVLSAKFTAVTFRQEDKLPPMKPAAGAAVKPATAPAVAPPPMPSSATPAGARARVEDAIDKGESKNRDAAGTADGKGSGSARLKGGI
jgi:Tfp pilus assembly protein PilO